MLRFSNNEFEFHLGIARGLFIHALTHIRTHLFTHILSHPFSHTYAHPFPWVALCLVQVTEHGNDRVQEVDVVRGRHVRFWCQGQVTGPRAVAA